MSVPLSVFESIVNWVRCDCTIEIYKCIWNDRIHLAASLARLRIKNSALSLLHLLPTHLQDNKVAIATANPIVTGWINPFCLRYIIIMIPSLFCHRLLHCAVCTDFCVNRTKSEARDRLVANGFIESQETEDGEVPLQQNHFKWDKICPLFLSCIPLDRSHFAKTSLMMDNQFIMQVRRTARSAQP